MRQACKSLYEKSGSVLIEEHKHSARVTVYTKAGYAAMRDNVGIGSSNKKLSDLLMRQDETFLRELVDAYVNGDGNVTRRNGAVEAGTYDIAPLGVPVAVHPGASGSLRHC